MRSLEIRRLFRSYLETGSGRYRNRATATAIEASLADAARLQNEIWTSSDVRVPTAGGYCRWPMLTGPRLEPDDRHHDDEGGGKPEPPRRRSSDISLASLSLVSALLIGYVTSGTRARSWFYQLLFALTMALTFNATVIMGIFEFPRLGLIRIDVADYHPLIELERSTAVRPSDETRTAGRAKALPTSSPMRSTVGLRFGAAAQAAREPLAGKAKRCGASRSEAWSYDGHASAFEPATRVVGMGELFAHCDRGDDLSTGTVEFLD